MTRLRKCAAEYCKAFAKQSEQLFTVEQAELRARPGAKSSLIKQNYLT